MNKPIKNIKLKFSCKEDWDKMTPNPKGRDCSKCCKTVIDFTNQDENFLNDHLSKNQNVCGRFNVDQVHKKYALSNAIAISSVFAFLELANIACVSEEKKQQKLIGILIPTTIPKLDSIPQLTGEIMGDLQTPKMYQVVDSATIEEIAVYIYQNIDNTTTDWTGNYNLEIYITKNGNLKEVKLIKGESIECFKKMKKILKNYKFKKLNGAYYFSLELVLKDKKNAE